MTVRKSYKCEDCGFYYDCPMDYNCPAKEMIEDLCSREGGIFMIVDGYICGICEKNNGDTDE